MDRNEREWENLGREGKPSAGVLSEIERRRVVDHLGMVLEILRDLRENQKLWLSMGPEFRVRFEDFQGDLAALRASWRK